MKDPIKIAFSKVKIDISNLENETFLIKKEILEIKSMLTSLHELLNDQVLSKISEKSGIFTPTLTPTDRQTNPTIDRYPTDTPTVPQEIGGLKTPNIEISTGNRGVPTDRQTNQQTDRQTQKTYILPDLSIKSKDISSSVESSILEASGMINSLNSIKKDIKLKFKSLTTQEMLIFSTIYEFEEKDPNNTTYETISSRLNLSESSIRDYTLKLIKKGIPIKKQKINNRKVLLSISPELKKLATLSTILQLREL
ncbi:helix-turn-helix domain-containing protein [Candidatus Pacearchaeota archaeon]|nr:helix-turn-helix domain-containing protein [Candidatus Pacearchaeota archaeon]